MKPRRPISPYMNSSDVSINARISLMRIRHRVRQIKPTYKHASLFQIRIMNKRAAHKNRPGMVR